MHLSCSTVDVVSSSAGLNHDTKGGEDFVRFRKDPESRNKVVATELWTGIVVGSMTGNCYVPFAKYQSHKTQKWIRTTAFDDYDDICILFGGKATTGKITVDVSQNATTARTCENEDKSIQDFVDSGLGSFEHPSNFPLLTQSSFVEVGDVYSPILPKTNCANQFENSCLRKRARNEPDFTTPATDIRDELMSSVSTGVTSIASHIDALRSIIEENVVDRRMEKMEKN